MYISDWIKHQVAAYSLTGQLSSELGQKGDRPALCAADSSGRVLVADEYNKRMQVLSPARGEWAVVPGVGVMKPTDLIILSDRMYVLDYDEISVFKI